MARFLDISPKFYRRKGPCAAKPARHTWRAVATLACALLASGCAQIGLLGGDYESLVQIATQGWSGGEREVSYEKVVAMPYASIGFRIGDGAQNMLLLVGATRDPMMWTAGGRMAVVTERGRIIRTGGLQHNLGGWFFQSVTTSEKGTPIKHWLVDFPEQERYSVPIACTETPVGEETVTVLGHAIQAKRMDEHCSSEASYIPWTFDNTYWYGVADGILWRSIQHVHPALDAVEVVTLRPLLKSQ